MTLSRIAIASSISYEVLKSPEAAINFICCVADEISLSEFIRIQATFNESLKYIRQKNNLNN